MDEPRGYDVGNMLHVINIAAQFLLRTFDSQSSEDEDDSMINELYQLAYVPEDRNPVVRITGYLENIVPSLTSNQFQEHFRLSRTSFDSLLSFVAPLLVKGQPVGRTKIDPCRQVLSVLWILATPDSYRSVGERFDMGKSSLFVSFTRVIKALCVIAPQVISWPRGERLLNITRDFERMGGIPNIIGAIDGTFVPIKAPKNDPESYVTRKCQHAITMQAICDSQLKFIDIFVGYPGSVSDTRIFRNSDIYNKVEESRADFFPPFHFIIGDKAYPALEWCVPPYKNYGNMTAAQIHFNTQLSSTRQTVERSFVLLFGRFRRLKYLDMNRVDLIPSTVLASCVLHNLCLNNVDQYLQEYEDAGMAFLNERNNHHATEQDADDFSLFEETSGLRDALCAMLY